MTEEEIQALGVKAQSQIEGAIKNAFKARAGLCGLAKDNPNYSDAIKATNSVLCDLLQAHSDGIEAMNLAPSLVIVPMFGSK